LSIKFDENIGAEKLKEFESKKLLVFAWENC
jgi:hypothetical protein